MTVSEVEKGGGIFYETLEDGRFNQHFELRVSL